jgi:hydrogenase maturation protease
MRVLVACVGNVLRGDDGFGVAVAARLTDMPTGVEVVETGIGGMSIVHRLMDGFDALVVVDAVDLEADPGAVVVIEPDVQDGRAMAPEAWQALFSNLHLAEPSRVLALARAAGALPPRVLLVGCQVRDCEDFAPELSAPVAAAVEVAAARVRALAAELAGEVAV